jgi:hypothetical protein
MGEDPSSRGRLVIHCRKAGSTASYSSSAVMVGLVIDAKSEKWEASESCTCDRNPSDYANHDLN